MLKNHAPDVGTFDVLPPMKHVSAEAYRLGWDDWQPDLQGDETFHLQDVSIVAGTDVAFAHYFIHCGGTLPRGQTFQDEVQADA